MAKNVFRPGEIKPVEDTVFLKLSHNYAPPVYSGTSSTTSSSTGGA